MTFEEFQQTRLATNDLRHIHLGAGGYEGFYWIKNFFAYKTNNIFKSINIGGYSTPNIDEIERRIYDKATARGEL